MIDPEAPDTDTWEYEGGASIGIRNLACTRPLQADRLGIAELHVPRRTAPAVIRGCCQLYVPPSPFLCNAHLGIFNGQPAAPAQLFKESPKWTE